MLLGVVDKCFVLKSLLTTTNIVLSLNLKQTLPPTIWIFTEGDGIESRLPFKTFSTLPRACMIQCYGVCDKNDDGQAAQALCL